MANKKKPIKIAASKAAKPKTNTKRKTVKKKPPKIIGELHSKSPEAKAIYKHRSYYKNRTKWLEKQVIYDARYAEKKNQEFLEYYNKTYPLTDE